MTQMTDMSDLMTRDRLQDKLPCVIKKHDAHRTGVRLSDTVVLGDPATVAVVAGPCAVESAEQLQEISETLLKLGIGSLRGGVFKPRTSPYSFQGLREEGLKLLGALRQKTGLAIVTEVMCPSQIEAALEHADCLQVGARNMQNFDLLKALGRQPKPVLLKRGLSATLEEFLMAAEYVLAEGNPNVILCERGIRSFDPASTRNVLDLASVALLKELTHLPVMVDPSHATGRRSLVIPAARAAVAVGADGITVEVHPTPEKSVSDAMQALSLQDLAQLVVELQPVALAVGRQLAARPWGEADEIPVLPHLSHLQSHSRPTLSVVSGSQAVGG